MYVAKLGNLYLESIQTSITGKVIEMTLTSEIAEANVFISLSGFKVVKECGLKLYKLVEKEVSEESEHY